MFGDGDGSGRSHVVLVDDTVGVENSRGVYVEHNDAEADRVDDALPLHAGESEIDEPALDVGG